MRFLKAFFVLTILALYSSGAWAQEANYRFHKVFFYSFTKYVEWPAEYSQGDFMIGVVGESTIIPLLKEMAEIKKVNERKIVVKKLSPEDLDNKWNIIFIPSNSENLFEKVHMRVKDQPTLLVTETDGLANKGSMINFKDVNGKLKFEVNTNLIRKNGMKISSALVNLGEQVN